MTIGASDEPLWKARSWRIVAVALAVAAWGMSAVRVAGAAPKAHPKASKTTTKPAADAFTKELLARVGEAKSNFRAQKGKRGGELASGTPYDTKVGLPGFQTGKETYIVEFEGKARFMADRWMDESAGKRLFDELSPKIDHALMTWTKTTDSNQSTRGYTKAAYWTNDGCQVKLQIYLNTRNNPTTRVYVRVGAPAP